MHAGAVGPHKFMLQAGWPNRCPSQCPAHAACRHAAHKRMIVLWHVLSGGSSDGCPRNLWPHIKCKLASSACGHRCTYASCPLLRCAGRKASRQDKRSCASRRRGRRRKQLQPKSEWPAVQPLHGQRQHAADGAAERGARCMAACVRSCVQLRAPHGNLAGRLCRMMLAARCVLPQERGGCAHCSAC